MSAERYLDPPVAEALKRLRSEDSAPFAQRGPWLEVFFPAANSPVDIRHRLGAVPTGYLCVFALGGNVRAASIGNWSTELAFLQADAANARARVCFVVTSEVPIDA